MAATAKVSIEAIKDALKAYSGNVAAVATHVGLSRTSLYERLDVADIKADEYRASRPVLTPVRLGYESIEALRQAAIDLAYLRRREYTTAAVLEEFIAEALTPWLDSKKGSKKGGAR